MYMDLYIRERLPNYANVMCAYVDGLMYVVVIVLNVLYASESCVDFRRFEFD